MACDSRAGLEAQKLISISLGKMAASRVGRTGASLHKSLLVASVLHRARHVFLEESYHVHRAAHPEVYGHPAPGLVAPMPMYAPPLPPTPPPAPVATEEKPVPDVEDKENRVSEKEVQQTSGEPCRAPLADTSNNRVAALKRRRCVSEQETQEAVSSILPKRPRTCPSPEPAITDVSDDECDGSSMEVDHITSLVSIFSFGGSRPDMCATQAAREDHSTFQPLALAV